MINNLIQSQSNTQSSLYPFLDTTKPNQKIHIKSKFPVSLFVDYQTNQLKFQWNLAMVKCPQGIYFRNVLIIDNLASPQPEDFFQIIIIFYKKLKLGDFFKVIHTNGELRKKGWIQKTGQKLQKEDFSFQDERKRSSIQCCQRMIKLANKLDESISISIITQNIDKDELIQISKLKKKQNKFIHILNIFFDSTKAKSGILWQYPLLQFYEFRKIQQLQQKFKIFIYDQNKIRALSSQIKLTCKNGDIFLRSNKQNCWVLEGDSLYNRVYGINNYTKYSCSIFINSFRLPILNMKLQFNLTFLGGSKHRMQKQFSIHNQTSNFNFEQVKMMMNYEFKQNRYSQMPKNIRIDVSRGQKILITEKQSKECYLTYQQELFR